MATILVVDDRPVNRQYLITLLGYSGYRMVEAGNGVEALAQARAEHPDLIITDIAMPKMDGIELVRRLSEDPDLASTPVIFFTATYRLAKARLMAQGLNPAGFIAKPAEPTEILEVVSTALGTIRPVPASTRVAAGAEEPADTLQQLQATSLRLTALIEFGMDLAEERDPGRLLELCCRAARKIIDARYSAIGILNDTGNGLGYLVTQGMDAHIRKETLLFSLCAGALPTALAERRAVRLDKLETDSVQARMVVPLMVSDQVFGWLYLADRLGQVNFSDEDERLAVTLASQLAMTYQNVLLSQAAKGDAESMRQRASYDSLTSLPNRTLFNDRLQQALAWAKRRSQSVAVMFVDLDHFKRINDSLGHAVGDALLVAAAGRLRDCVRETDTVARYGGDEFVLVLSEQDDGGGFQGVARHILESFALPVALEGHELSIACSIGVSLYPKDGDNPEALLRSADIAMYEAKEKGRNQCQEFCAEMDSPQSKPDSPETPGETP